MNTQESGPGADEPAVKMQAIKFDDGIDDGRAVVFKSTIGDIKLPTDPVLELTITMASPAGDPKAEREIREFLDGVQAGFIVTPPRPDGGPGENQDLDPFNVDDEILFATRLIRPDASKVPVGVTVVIQVTVKGYSTSERVPIALASGVLRMAALIVRRHVRSYNVTYVNSSVVNWGCHRHGSRTGGNMTATVTSISGSANVFPNKRKINTGNSVVKVVPAVRVCGLPSCSYRVREVT